MDILKKSLSYVLLMYCLVKALYGCSCWPSHLQHHVCSEGTFAALIEAQDTEYYYRSKKLINVEKILKRAKGEREDPSAEQLMSDYSYADEEDTKTVEVVLEYAEVQILPSSFQFFINIRHKVKVVEAYQGLSQSDVNEEITITSTSYLNSCAINLAKGQTYLIVGSIEQDGSFFMEHCHYHVPWNNFNSIQQNAIKSFMLRPQETCSSGCSVQSCYSCYSTNDTCSLNSYPFPQDYHECAREGGADSDCIWKNRITP